MDGFGVATGAPMLIARELESRILVPVFDSQAEAPERCCLITTEATRQRPRDHSDPAFVFRFRSSDGKARPVTGE